MLLVCIVRLAQLQFNSQAVWHSQIEKWRTGQQKRLPAVRGKIIDRNSVVLAEDRPRFSICIDYSLAELLDDRYWQALVLQSAQKKLTPRQYYEKIRLKRADELDAVQFALQKCAQFRNVTPEFVREKILNEIIEPVWQLRYYLAGARNFPGRDFEQAVPDANQRLILASQVDLAEMHESHPIWELQNDDEVLAAELAFIDIPGIAIKPGSVRVYEYGEVAPHTVGWVLPWRIQDAAIVPDDELSRYRYGELSGFEGVERLCEPLLRGRGGQVVYSIDNEIMDKKQTLPGMDIQLTLDISLQQKIIEYLKNPDENPNYDKPVAVVIIEVAGGEILASISLPGFDLNRVRSQYGLLLKEPDTPLIDRVLNCQYPPGSTIKPIILIAALQEHKISAEEIISCPSVDPPAGWPRCLMQRKYGIGHDQMWPNNARNAIRGSCNIYFSQLAARIEPGKLQEWLWKFGFGHTILDSPDFVKNSYGRSGPREFRQARGIISSSGDIDPNSPYSIPPINGAERRYFGIGQGNLRASPLQIANAMATIARGGIFMNPRLIRTQDANEYRGSALDIDPYNLAVAKDGMYAVVNESGGTAYDAFINTGFDMRGVTVYGKTGSTERPYNALFAGFAEDEKSRSIAFAIVIEAGQSGALDTAPVARQIVDYCIQAGYIGTQ